MKKISIHTFLAFVAIVVFVIFKFPHLSLPYYWDEGWVYGPAVMHMYEAGISMSPDIISEYYTRGHPLLFHVLTASWMKLFGASIFSAHCFALFVSVSVLVSIFVICTKYISPKAGLISLLLAVVQPIFLAQSALVLPEMMLALFVLLSLFFYVNNQKAYYWLAAACAIMTKESAIIIFCTLGLYEGIAFIKSAEKNFLSLIYKGFFAVSPIIVWLLFLVWQKQVNGWYFFPEHTGYISFDIASIWNKLERYFAYLYLFQGRNMTSVAAIIALVFFIIRKQYKSAGKTNELLIVFTLFSLLFLIFSSLNFYSDRYLLCLIPLLAISAAALLVGFYKRFIYLVVIALVTSGLYNSLYKKTNADHNLGYVETVHAYQQTVDYLVSEKLKDKHFYAYFLMKENLVNPYTGYVTLEQKFTNVFDGASDKCDYFIVSNTEGEKEFEVIKTQYPLELIKRIENKHVWVEIYKKQATSN